MAPLGRSGAAVREGLARAFLTHYGWILAIAGVVLGVIAWVWKPSESVPLAVFVIATSTLLSLCFLLLKVAYDAFDSHILPKVIKGLAVPASYPAGVALILLEPSRLFANDLVVSIYRNVGGMEILVASGFVVSTQADNSMQILVTSQMDEADDAESFWKSVLVNNETSMSQLVVRPGIPRTVLAIQPNQAHSNG